MRYKKIKNKSDKKIIRDKIGKLHLEILRMERGLRCEICGKYNPSVGRFHIISVARSPRLEFCDDNILLSCWMPCHYSWHHMGPLDKRNERTVEIIKKKLGEDWESNLREKERMHDKHDMLYLEALFTSMEDKFYLLKNAQ